MSIEVKDDSVLLRLQTKIDNISDNEQVMTECHNIMASYMEPYVPMKMGVLFRSAIVTPHYVRYGGASVRYAHYMFEGIVYGPNIPIFENGVITGWFSLPKQRKHPTGAMLSYSEEGHPLATHHWHKAMINDKSEEFTADIKKVITEALNNG